jgi:threonine dehydrogenase-like Zn-dependent dehydrogenase
MRATVMYEAGDVRVEDVPDPTIVEPTDALIRVTAPASAAATSTRTTGWSAARPGPAWATRPWASSRT